MKQRESYFDLLVIVALLSFLVVCALGIKIWEELDRFEVKVDADILASQSLNRIADIFDRELPQETTDYIELNAYGVLEDDHRWKEQTPTRPKKK